MSDLLQLNTITNRILNAGETAYGELYQACNELYQFLMQQNNVNAGDEATRKDIWLDNGKAIGTTWAAMCIKDIMRTKRFMDGVYQATRDVLNANPHQQVCILYTGTGPFATLILPLLARFTSKQVQFKFVEINPESLEFLGNMFAKYGLLDYILSAEQADATKLKLPVGERIDIFICETMQEALKNEPQVALCLNIVPQLPPETIIIPEQITLKAALLKAQNNPVNNGYDNSLLELGTLFAVNRHELLNHAARFSAAKDDSELFPTVHIAVPGTITGYLNTVYILTELQVYRDVKFRLNESQLSMPHKLQKLQVRGGDTISFEYFMGNKPGLRYTISETVKV